jgi:hypothetical protein
MHTQQFARRRIPAQEMKCSRFETAHCRLVMWDFSKGRPLQILDLSDEWEASPDTSARLFNPPLIHSVATPLDDDFSDAGHLAAVSRGDGAVAVYDLDYRESRAASRGAASGKSKRKGAAGKPRKGSEGGDGEQGPSTSGGAASGVKGPGVPGRRCFIGAEHGGHKSSAAYAGFARFGGPGEFLISGGNDGRVNFWRWQDAMESRCSREGTADESEGEASGKSDTETNGEGDSDGATKGSKSAAARAGAKERLLSLRHGKKVNWLATSSLRDGKVIVADTSRHMRVYNFQ